jgi:ketosteroid isomerase-like protein
MSMAQGYPTLDGRAAIQAAVEEAMTGLRVTGHTITFETVEGVGDLAYTTGTYVEAYAVEGGDQPIEVRGRVLGVLRKQPDGAWRIAVWSTNTES